MYDAIQSVSVTPTVSASSAYADGDLVGTKMTFTDLVTSTNDGMVMTVVIEDLAKQNAVLKLILFDADPSNTTFTDNAALDVHDTDLSKVIGHVSVAATDYVSLSDNSFATVSDIGLAFKSTGTTIYGALVTTGTPTYAATSDIKVTITALRQARP